MQIEPGVLDLRAVFELVIDAFQNGPFALEELVQLLQQAVLHIRAQLGRQLQIIVFTQLTGQVLRDLVFVREQLAE